MGGETTILGSGSWAEVVRKSKKKIKKASFSPTKFRAGTKKTTPKTTPLKIKDLNSEGPRGENPKSRSLKKRADKAAANAARHSVTRKPSSKKKPKKKMLQSCEVLTDYYEETSMVSTCQYTEEPKLTIGDFLQGKFTDLLVCLLIGKWTRTVLSFWSSFKIGDLGHLACFVRSSDIFFYFY